MAGKRGFEVLAGDTGVVSLLLRVEVRALIKPRICLTTCDFIVSRTWSLDKSLSGDTGSPSLLLWSELTGVLLVDEVLIGDIK